jgi:hypothetical protein
MTRKTSTKAKPINGVGSGEDGETIVTRTRQTYFPKGEDRKRRRRLDLKTLHGTMRESARVYRELAEGRISLEHAEVRSRVLGRHREILSSLEQTRQLAAIQEQLQALRAEPGFVVAPQIAGTVVDEAKA